MAVRFTYTLEGYIEAQRFLEQNGWLEKIKKEGRLRGLELVEEANRLYNSFAKRSVNNNR